MRGVILKTVSKCTDTTTNTQYGHAAVWALVLLWNKQLTTKKQVKCSFLYF